MKNILFTTDLSEEAHEAALQAARLAFASGARLILLHSLELPQEADASEDLQQERTAQDKLDALANELYQQYNISVTRLLLPGLSPAAIDAIASQVKADKVLTGTFPWPPATQTFAGALPETGSLMAG